MSRNPNHEQLYSFLNGKYSHVQYIEGEELNIYRVMNSVIEKLYRNGLSLNRIAEQTGLCRRTIERRIKELEINK